MAKGRQSNGECATFSSSSVTFSLYLGTMTLLYEMAFVPHKGHSLSTSFITSFLVLQERDRRGKKKARRRPRGVTSLAR